MADVIVWRRRTEEALVWPSGRRQRVRKVNWLKIRDSEEQVHVLRQLRIPRLIDGVLVSYLGVQLRSAHTSTFL